MQHYKISLKNCVMTYFTLPYIKVIAVLVVLAIALSHIANTCAALDRNTTLLNYTCKDTVNFSSLCRLFFDQSLCVSIYWSHGTGPCSKKHFYRVRCIICWVKCGILLKSGLSSDVKKTYSRSGFTQQSHITQWTCFLGQTQTVKTVLNVCLHWRINLWFYLHRLNHCSIQVQSSKVK